MFFRMLSLALAALLFAASVDFASAAQGIPAGNLRASRKVVLKSADWVLLNPQPLPPGGAASLNPQPLPPRDLGLNFKINPLLKRGLNPQPLPPRW